MIMLKKIQTGCQTGADIAAADAAICEGFPYTGWVPKGRRTEQGPLDKQYKVFEMPTTGYPPRTKRNIAESDGTVIFTHGALTGGSALTKKFAQDLNKRYLHINFSKITVPEAIAELNNWLLTNDIEILNVAGRSASKDPEIYPKVYEVILNIIKANQ